MKTVIEMAREATLLDSRDDWSSVPDEYREAINAFAELVRADERNATLDEIADKIGKMPFGDTAASFAVWIREQKT
jgi:hypothetical protein